MFGTSGGVRSILPPIQESHILGPSLLGSLRAESLTHADCPLGGHYRRGPCRGGSCGGYVGYDDAADRAAVEESRQQRDGNLAENRFGSGRGDDGVALDARPGPAADLPKIA